LDRLHLLVAAHRGCGVDLDRHAQGPQSQEARRVAATEFRMSAQHSGGCAVSRYPNSQTGFYEYPMYGNHEPDHPVDEDEDQFWWQQQDEELQRQEEEGHAESK